MDFNEHKTLEGYFLSIDGDRQFIFPNNANYVKRYAYLSSELNKWVHPYVISGSMVKDKGYLNDHGPEHIKKVMLRASELMKGSALILSEYEMYILLVAIHIHDIGNILGRNEHEINSLEIIKKYGLDAGQDRIEWDCIFEIAESHGGNPKDKISALVDEKILDFKVRKRLLAALLKLADEFADDRTRASRFQLENDLIPNEAVLYHKFSYCLHSVDIDIPGKQVKLQFDVEEDDLDKTFLKKEKKELDIIDLNVHLIDEIYKRTYKTHLERIYCSRFLRQEIEIDKIRVAIQIVCNKKDERNHHVKYNIIYDLGEVGYPSFNDDDFFTLCPLLKESTGIKIIEKLKSQTLTHVTATH